MSDFVTRTEWAYLIAVSMLTSLLSITNLAVIILTPILYPPPFEIYDISRGSQFPLFRFLIIFPVLLIVRGRRFVVPLLFTTFALIPAYVEFTRSYRAVVANFEVFEKINSLFVLLTVANPLDYVTFLLANLMLIWLGTLVIRSYTIGNRRN